MRIGSGGHPGIVSWHTSCSHIPTNTEPFCALSGATVAGTGGVEGEQVRAEQPRRPNEGVLHLVLRRAGQRTVLQEGYFQVPLQVLRPLYLDDVGTAYVYLLSPCGGVVGGDVYSMTVVVEAGARAGLTSPSASRLYATSGTAAQQRHDIPLPAD